MILFPKEIPSLTWILQTVVTLRFRMSCVQDLLRDVLRHNLVEDIVCGQGERLLIEEQSFRQQCVQIVWRHHVVLASEWEKPRESKEYLG